MIKLKYEKENLLNKTHYIQKPSSNFPQFNPKPQFKKLKKFSNKQNLTSNLITPQTKPSSPPKTKIKKSTAQQPIQPYHHSQTSICLKSNLIYKYSN